MEKISYKKTRFTFKEKPFLYILLIFTIPITIFSLSALISGERPSIGYVSMSTDYLATTLTLAVTGLISIFTLHKLYILNIKTARIVSLILIIYVVGVLFLLFTVPRWDITMSSKGYCNLIVKSDLLFRTCNERKLLLED